MNEGDRLSDFEHCDACGDPTGSLHDTDGRAASLPRLLHDDTEGGAGRSPQAIPGGRGDVGAYP
jgi:hypothetical protein